MGFQDTNINHSTWSYTDFIKYNLINTLGIIQNHNKKYSKIITQKAIVVSRLQI